MIRGCSGLAEPCPARDDLLQKGGFMRQDILIATSMVAASIVVLLAIVVSVARATREPADA
jgi:hypothetical protein